MLQIIRGRVVQIALDDVDTDVIVPSEFRHIQADDDKELKTLRPHVMEAIRPGLDGYVRSGDVFVVGKNFGCESHREPAVLIFKVWGVQAVVTESAARIWFRNAIAAGLPVFELKDATKLFDEGDQIQIDLGKWCVINETKKSESYPLPPYPDTVMRILDVGGIFQLVKQRLAAEQPGEYL